MLQYNDMTTSSDSSLDLSGCSSRILASLSDDGNPMQLAVEEDLGDSIKILSRQRVDTKASYSSNVAIVTRLKRRMLAKKEIPF